MAGEKQTGSDRSFERRKSLYTGRVQGVGFRYTTRQIAERYQVTGYVQNLPDGSVRLVSEGETGELKRFLDAVESELDRYISHVDMHSEPATGEFADFDIRR